MPVHEPRELGAEDGGGERDRRGEPAGEPVPARELGDHRDDADPHHRERHPPDEPRGREGEGAGRAEDRAVGAGQGGLRAGVRAQGGQGRRVRGEEGRED
ncbi:putative transmembrane efflux protein [Streptomyces sp. Tu6071]|nr:putative transmembrane efflux protein [Streptomyces sp. Tu6071]